MAGARADIGKPLGRAGHRAAVQHQPEAQLVQKRQFPAQVPPGPVAARLHGIQQILGPVPQMRVRIALWQRIGQKRGHGVQPGERRRIVHQPRARCQRLGDEGAKLVGEPRPPAQ